MRWPLVAVHPRDDRIVKAAHENNYLDESLVALSASGPRFEKIEGIWNGQPTMAPLRRDFFGAISSRCLYGANFQFNP